MSGSRCRPSSSTRPTAVSRPSATAGHSTTCISAFALQGLHGKVKGQFSRDELAPLAKINLESLKEYSYFTYATADGKKVPFGDPLPGYWLDDKDAILTLNFTLPFKTPVKAQLLRVEIYDPTIFVDFEFAKGSAGQARRRAAGLQARRGAAEADNLRSEPETGRAVLRRPDRRPELGRAILQQDPGELPVTAPPHVWTASDACRGRRDRRRPGGRP